MEPVESGAEGAGVSGGARTVPDMLAERARAALAALGHGEADARVTATSDRRFGDYQTNVAMLLARRIRTNPRELAARVAESIDVAGLCSSVDVAGPGFLNFTLDDGFVWSRLGVMAGDPRLGVPRAGRPMRIVLDFSAPNVAKPMHVGHIRSTILGDALARVARVLGHEVVTDNHIGDWGTQFGKVIYGWRNFLDRDALDRDAVGELVRLYRKVNALCDEDAGVLDACRRELVRLQAGDEASLAIWREAVRLSMRDFDAIYARLGIRFDETLGESFYNDRLEPLCRRLEAEGIAETSEGALCVFFPDHPDLKDTPCLIRKSDGGYLYATTDLATLEYRRERWNPDAVWYVTGAPQRLHFQQIFAVAERMGLGLRCEHIAFGSILGEDRKLMKTRSGENVQLTDVLDEAVGRARAMVAERHPDMGEEETADLAATIGLGAVKYAELSQHRMTDYVFSWDRMLSLQGNTAPYLQNAYVRIRSIFRKAGEPPVTGGDVTGADATSEERDLALALFRYGEAVEAVLDDFRPNILAGFLHELATLFHTFYERCPVLPSEGVTKARRLLLCHVTARVIESGLCLLGIRVPERM